MAGRTDTTMVLTCISMLGNNIVSTVYKSLYINNVVPIMHNK